MTLGTNIDRVTEDDQLTGFSGAILFPPIVVFMVMLSASGAIALSLLAKTELPEHFPGVLQIFSPLLVFFGTLIGILGAPLIVGALAVGHFLGVPPWAPGALFVVLGGFALAAFFTRRRIAKAAMIAFFGLIALTNAAAIPQEMVLIGPTFAFILGYGVLFPAAVVLYFARSRRVKLTLVN